MIRAGDRLARVQVHDRLPRTDEGSLQADASEQLVLQPVLLIGGESCVDEPLKVENVPDDEAIGGVAGVNLRGTHAVALVAMDAGAAEEAEFIFAEAVEVRASRVVEFQPRFLELRQIPVL